MTTPLVVYYLYRRPSVISDCAKVHRSEKEGRKLNKPALPVQWMDSAQKGSGGSLYESTDIYSKTSTFPISPTPQELNRMALRFRNVAFSSPRSGNDSCVESDQGGQDNRTNRILIALRETLSSIGATVIWTATYTDRKSGDVIVRLRPSVTEDSSDTAITSSLLCKKLRSANSTLQVFEICSPLDGADEVEVRLPSVSELHRRVWNIVSTRWCLSKLWCLFGIIVVASVGGLLAVANGTLTDETLIRLWKENVEPLA